MALASDPLRRNEMQVIENMEDPVERGVSALVVPCSARKAKLSAQTLTSGSLTAGKQATLAQQWLRKLQKSNPCAKAGHLYSGAAFRRVYEHGLSHGTPVWVISAGLGLVSAERRVPPYDLTLSASSPTSLVHRVVGHFRHERWWDQVQAGPFASPLSSIGDSNGQGRVLIALTKPYAQLISKALAGLPTELRSRLRLFGPGVAASLPADLRSQVLKYDQRLDLIVPGIQLDAAARALVHFAELAANIQLVSMECDQELIEQALAPVQARPVVLRTRLDDDALREHLRPWASEGLSFRTALRRLRDDSRVSCEEQRFRRLYNEVRA
ncbi:TPA: DUF6884 domain-containing protein [Stenotrophomonas maltophilia]|jgi:hypothetical protein